MTADLHRQAFARRIREALHAHPYVAFACLHGSFIADGPYRDVDVAVWLDPDHVPDRDRLRCALDLGAALSAELRISVDVQPLNSASPAFRYHALNGQLLFARDPEFFADIRARTWDEYFDLLPFARQHLRDLLSA